MTLVLGIDPGLKGGLVVYDPATRAIKAKTPTPIKDSHREGKHEVDGQRLSEILAEWIADLGQPICAHVELVAGRPGQVGQFQFGMNTGVVVGVVQAYAIPISYVAANKWKAAYGLQRAPGESNYEWKNRSIDTADKIFPNTGFHGQDGVAEAALIAFYGEHSK